MKRLDNLKRSDFKDLTGKKFSFWRVLHIDKVRYSKKNIFFICKCKCGNIKSVASQNLLSKVSISCGCSRRILQGSNKTVLETPEYFVWFSMISRCTKTNSSSYKNYGGRGITVCKRWLNSFKLFYKDMGSRPDNTFSIERINNDRGYKPSNCKWATRSEQRRNMRVK